MTETAAKWRTLDLVYIALFAVLMAVCAWISIPVPKPLIPFTLQTFAVFAALTALGGKRGTFAILAYILLGLIGLPVFSGFQGGLGVLLNTTGGYIWGFILAGLIFWFLTSIFGNSILVEITAILLGIIACYTFGTAWFMILYAQTKGPIGLLAALGYCVFPFILPDLIKAALAITLSQRVKKYLK